MLHDHILKKLNVDLVTHPQGLGESVGKYLLLLAAFMNLFNLIRNNVNFDLLTPSQGSEGGVVGVCGQYLLPCFCIS